MARLPDNLRIYAVGDVHGRADLLDELFETIDATERERTPAASHMVFLGDYIDRGSDSHGVVERLLHGLPAGLEADFLMGNHEQMMLDGLESEDALTLWLANGGAPVIESYASAARRLGAPMHRWDKLADMLPPAHVDFFESLQICVQYGDYFFVHAGVRPGVPLDQQALHDMLWIRKPFLDYLGNFGKVVVHGHTPVERPVVYSNRIAIDTGAVFTGRLTALVLEGDRQDFLVTG